jgi:hypothetical protein
MIHFISVYRQYPQAGWIQKSSGKYLRKIIDMQMKISEEGPKRTVEHQRSP